MCFHHSNACSIFCMLAFLFFYCSFTYIHGTTKSSPTATSLFTLSNVAALSTNSIMSAQTEPSTRCLSPDRSGSADQDEATKAAGPGEELLLWTGSIGEGVMQLTRLAVAYKNGSATAVELMNRRNAVASFLSYLEVEVTPSPDWRASLGRAFNLYSPEGPENFRQAPIPEDIRGRVNDIHQTFVEANWGQGEGADEVASSSEDTNPGEASSPTGSLIRRGSSTAANGDAQGQGVSIIRAPPANHPIWGHKGIMHGFVRVKPPRRGWSIRFNPALLHLKKPAKVFGHNGLTPGDWWPSRMVAVFHGAHGHNVQGISGTAGQGAWSIVCSGRSHYHKLDRDEGWRLFYSADGADKNTNKTAVVVQSESTKALLKSLETKVPVRVLRSAGKENRHCPSVGVRYDGLYVVVAKHDRRNDLGGMYYSFELHRVENQPGSPLEEIERRVPSGRQVYEESKIKEWY
ncbi:E3 ubiquitin-protein ligase UHRF1 [Cladorrhinum sp. PSN259]|nr:E3 ubiquitin-protein ligase UHRF1 [Cladorrhinum sp. PSN259]